MIGAFIDTIQQATGFSPDPAKIVPGKLGRFSTSDRRGDENGWYRLFEDQEGGVFGCWRQGVSETWQARQPASPEQRAAFQEKVRQAREEAARLQEQQRAECRKKSAELWELGRDVDVKHGYILAKQIKPYGAKQLKESVIVPVRDTAGILHGLQFIGADGGKRFKSGTAVAGCYHSIGKPNGKLLVAEGFATAATLHESTGLAVACAFNSGNLKPVAESLRAKYPNLQIIVCTDDDHLTDGNPGLTKATEAARAVGGLLARPVFPESKSAKDTDFNDLARLAGLAAVKACIDTAAMPEPCPIAETAPQGATESVISDSWPEPLPIEAKMEPLPYPLDALPESIRVAVEEVVAFVKAPVVLVASAALSAVSMAVQSRVDVARAEKLTGPCGLYLLSIAESGERKSTCDGFFTRAIRDYEAKKAEDAKPEVKRFEAEQAAFDAKIRGITDSIRQAAKAGESTEDIEADLLELQQKKPEPPRVPRIVYGDITPEALKYALAKQWPSGAVVSSEAGIVFGSHGMGKESAMRNLATLNQLWDGTDMPTERRSSESFTVRGARLTMALQVQESTLRAFFKASGELARGTGFLARFLIAWPESTQGQRPFTEAPDNWPALAAFNTRISEILNQDVLLTGDGALQPDLLNLSPEAKAAWINFHDVIESELSTGGALFGIRDVASKIADNAARLACLLHYFEHGNGDIGLDAFVSASRIAAWHLSEARRFFGGLALPVELADAARLDEWLLSYCRQHKTSEVPVVKVQQYGPCGLRPKVAIDAAMEELESLERARRVKDGKRRTIHLNPALLGGEV